jgi:hypothetical protein
LRFPEAAPSRRNHRRPLPLPLQTRIRSIAIVLTVVALGGAAPSTRAADTQRPALPDAGAARALPPRALVADAVQVLRRDPDLQETEIRRTLRWKKKDVAEPDKPVQDETGWARLLAWLAEALKWLASAGRWLVWLLGALAVAILAVYLRYWVRVHGDFPVSAPLALPGQVGALDVRPETLPDHIGAEARRLWLSGAHRAALSLLYRGALSRLIHVHAVPIRAANTEAECVRLAQRALVPERSAFFARLVAVWQLAVYGARDPDGARVLALCDEFDRLLGVTPPGGAA